MDDLQARVSYLAAQSGMSACVGFEARLLVPEQRIRAFCLENKCGSYGANYMCPPHVGSLEETDARLRTFSRGVLLQRSTALDARGDIEGLVRTKADFHERIVELEGLLKGEGVGPVWGMIGGNCALCDVCRAAAAEPCPHPDRARTSLEALGIDVLALLEMLGLDSAFHPDRITWTGCILF